MKKVALFFLLPLFCISTLYSQPVGYMGKRFILTHNSFYFPAFEEPSFRSTKGFKMNFTKCLGIDYAVTPKNTLCIAVQYYLTGVSYKTQTGYYSSIVHEQGSTVPAKLSVMQYSLGLKKFNRRSFAPIGFYIKWELLFLQYTLKYNPDGFYVYDSRYYYPTLVKTDGGSGIIKMNGIGTAFSGGRQRIFADKIVVNYGLRIALNSPLAIYRFKNQAEQSMASNAVQRALGNQFFNVNLGIGFLAF